MASLCCNMLMMMMVIIMAVFLKASCNISTTTTTFCAGKANGVYANPQSCSSFWACWDNGLHGSLLLCPPNSLWHPHSLSCTHTANINTTTTSPVNATSSIAVPSNSSFCTHPPRLHLPIWSWDGLLHCYGYGCSHHHMTQPHTLIHAAGNTADIGIPCMAAQELISIAKRSTEAWMPAPHEFAAGDVLGKGAAGQHWKIRFDALEGENMLKASITDYSPAERIMGGWQGGAMGDQAVQFSLKGPSRGGLGGCYYTVALESPAFEGMWAAFAKDLVKESNTNKFNNKGTSVLGTQANNMAQVGDLFSIKRRKSHAHTTIQECLTDIPWASLVATVLCYVSNAGGGLQSMSFCSADLPSSDLFTIAKCFTSLLGISSDLGL